MMPQTRPLESRYPVLASRLPRLPLAALPTPAREVECQVDGVRRRLSIKYDNLTGGPYGGNKVRKLEFLLARARERGCRRIATFGAVGSNHALATALYAREAGFDCTCFLSHQPKTVQVPATLRKHLEIGTELVRYGGAYASRIATLRRHLWHRRAWVIPMGGSSWLGTMGFVAAGLELAAAVDAGDIPRPGRLYVGAGTMGTAAGIALGLALAGLDTEVHAVRVSDRAIMNEKAFRRLMQKTISMMHRLDDSVPPDVVDRARVCIRHDCFGPGYARGTDATEEAIEFAGEQLDLELETTYTGKTMSALLADWRRSTSDDTGVMYWHTYHALPPGEPGAPARGALPEAFLEYLDG